VRWSASRTIPPAAAQSGGSQRGKAFSIVKVGYAPDELVALLGDLGWTAAVTLLSPSTYVLQAVSGARR
jgi:hypothetical protein